MRTRRQSMALRFVEESQAMPSRVSATSRMTRRIATTAEVERAFVDLLLVRGQLALLGAGAQGQVLILQFGATSSIRSRTFCARKRDRCRIRWGVRRCSA